MKDKRKKSKYEAMDNLMAVYTTFKILDIIVENVLEGLDEKDRLEFFEALKERRSGGGL